MWTGNLSDVDKLSRVWEVTQRSLPFNLCMMITVQATSMTRGHGGCSFAWETQSWQFNITSILQIYFGNSTLFLCIQSFYHDNKISCIHLEFFSYFGVKRVEAQYIWRFVLHYILFSYSRDMALPPKWVDLMNKSSKNIWMFVLVHIQCVVYGFTLH